MRLTKEQIVEVRNYISNNVKYRETFNEIYDHILNALNAKEKAYSLDLVCEILNEDFGGIVEIQNQEVICTKVVTSQYFKFFRDEIINTFKWPDILSNFSLILLWVFIYISSLRVGFNIKPITGAIGIIVILMCIFYYFKRYYLDRKEDKPSIKYPFLQASTFFGISIYIFIFFWFISRDSLVDISYNSKNIIVLSLFFLTSIYLRAFTKLYNKKIKILSI